MKIILGSSSPFRKRVFAELGFPFETMSPDIDEKAIRNPDPYKLTIAIAHAKADALITKLNEAAVLVTGDQVVVSRGEILEKPKDVDEARRFLRCHSDHYLEAINGTAVTNTLTGERAEENDVVRVTFNTIPESIIDALIAEGGVMHCSGAVQTENPLLQPYIKSFEGSVDSIMGVPKEIVMKLIARVAPEISNRSN